METPLKLFFFFFIYIFLLGGGGKTLEGVFSICGDRRVFSGLQRVHHPRDEPAEGAEPNAADLAQGDRAHGEHHPREVQHHPDAAEAEHVRGRHDPAVPLPRRQVRQKRRGAVRRWGPSASCRLSARGSSKSVVPEFKCEEFAARCAREGILWHRHL